MSNTSWRLVKCQSGFGVEIQPQIHYELIKGDDVSENANVAATANPSVAANGSGRIEEVEKDVKKLKADVDNFMTLKNTVDDLKNTIVDIRSLLSETQNPFNLLQLITSEEDMSKVAKAKPLVTENKLPEKEQTEKLEAKGQPETQTVAGCEPKKAEEVGFAVESYVETKDIVETKNTAIAPPICETIKPETELISEKQVLEQGGKEKMANSPLDGIGSANKGTSLVQWVYTMLDLGFDEESIQRICDYCEFSDFMPKGYSQHVSNLVGAIVKARSQNISAEEVILSIYGAAQAAGVKTDPQGLSGLIMRVLKKCKAGEP